MMNRVLAMALLLAACKGSAADPPDSGQPPNCAFIDASACVQPTPSYATDIVPILDRRCNSTCHAPGVGPWPLNNYSDVFDWADIIGSYIETCGMPPDDAGAGDGNMTDDERRTVLNWLACGAPDN